MLIKLKDDRPKTFVGIDPGKTGAAAALHDNGFELHDFKDAATAARTIHRWRDKYDIQRINIERVNSTPNDGHVGAFKFGKNAGLWEGLIRGALLGSLLVFDTPAVWKRKMLPPTNTKDRKENALQMVREMFPDARHLFRRKKDHDRAEALLLAIYTRDKYGKPENLNQKGAKSGRN